MRWLLMILLLLLDCSTCLADATVASGKRASIALSTTIEEGRKMLVATVTVDGKPLENARVALFVRRTFGELSLGEETTLDDGTAAVPFPQDLPGDAGGQLQVIARLKTPPQYMSVVSRETLPGGAVVVVENDPFPRAIWAPQAPLALIMVFVVLLGGVWGTYLFVVIQLKRIKPRSGVQQ